MRKNKSNITIILVTFCIICIFSLVSCGSNEADDKVFYCDEAQSINEVSDAGGYRDTEEDKEAGKGNERKVFVYITGAVRNPGVYELAEGARLCELIELAGGFSEKAKKDYLNLAAAVADGEHIVVPTKSEYRAMAKKSKDSAPDINNENEQGQLLNINRADLNELLSLPGIGNVKATAIITYRSQQGNFQKIEDIMNVDGIGESLYSKIKDLITVE